MSTDNDVARSLGSWLREDRHEDADRVLDVVFDQIPATPQRRAGWLARRFPPMNNAVKIVIAAAVVVLAAIIGFTYYNNNVGSDQPTPVASPVALPSPGPLAAGSYVMASTFTPVGFSFTVPDGWAVDKDGFITRHLGGASELGFSSWNLTHVFGNACHWKGTGVPVAGMIPADIAAALAGQLERTTSGPADLVLGGVQAKRVVLSEPAGFDATACDSGIVRTWPDTGGSEDGGWRQRPGQTDTVFILDVNGTRLVIDMWRLAGASEADVTQLEGIIASITF